MLPSDSILQQIGLGVLVALGVVWAVGMTRLLRRGRYEAALRRDQREMRTRYASRGRYAPGGSFSSRGPEGLPGAGLPVQPELLGSVPRQTGPDGPPSECVELSAAERAAFEGLVRRLTSRS
ncbi:hypothetical protein SLV14_004717 [Streptomyces sp. Je 1-4]|uniref:hypothetical protein n=1 Tax=Streptomyces TaxID=1883 RepID=UPI00140F4B2A|nr:MULTISPECIES: hypothetical protein [unclassified Streptomyces]QIK08279.1 hypothetical protein G7Z12_21855 [Streptomyces sp. ID38640]UYB41908.1 hypothetical protein SLV14_004717 [Streptomyces sp. Je 1-4]UZQ38177.1 hypothetical protein SLV14N_004717 [Streptomyces sp. Je 1-4] [Streptomyces sp. Je 1-4 4N24]UZQ45594.1 hypothetical protein SLV14NA_004717 [Streptomyces sp. Je 1-4] [Streptomyces sp. Je 1-4 4N24_ara]